MKTLTLIENLGKQRRGELLEKGGVFEVEKKTKDDPKLIIKRELEDSYREDKVCLKYLTKYGSFPKKKKGYANVEIYKKSREKYFLRNFNLSKDELKIFDITHFFPNDHRVYVGKNVGQRTLEFLISEARGCGADLVKIDSSRFLMKALLEKNGFKKINQNDVNDEDLDEYYKFLK